MQTDKIKSWDRLIEKEDERDVSLSVWRAMIEQISKDDISSAKILDFGCDRGGFLRMLYDAKPFKKAVGVECATDKAAVANQLRGKRPIYYGHDDELSAHKSSFDYAFSHGSVHLLPELDAHARDVYDALKPGGVYYLATGDYAENPLWPRWYNVVYEESSLPPQNYSLNDIVKSFDKAGFAVAVNRLNCHGFFSYQAGGDRYFKNPLELVRYMTEYMMVFRLERPA